MQYLNLNDTKWWKDRARRIAHTTKVLAGSARYGFPTANLECIGVIGSQAPQTVRQITNLLKAAKVAVHTVHITKDLITHAETSLQQDLASLSSKDIATVLFLIDEDALEEGVLGAIAFNLVVVAEKPAGDIFSSKTLANVTELCKRARDACVLNVDSTSFRVLQPASHSNIYTYGQSDLADVRLLPLTKGVAIQYDDTQTVLPQGNQALLVAATVARVYDIDPSTLNS